LSDDSQKYGVENTCTSGNTLSRAATYFGKARSLIEKERGNMLKAFGTQVCSPTARCVVYHVTLMIRMAAKFECTQF
jgi:hypothetical protein